MNGKYKILLMAHVRFFNAEVQYALDLGLELQKRGHEVVMFMETGSLGVPVAKRMGLSVYEEDGFNVKGFKAVCRSLSAAGKLSAKLSREEFDAVFVFRSEGFPLIFRAAKKAGAKVVRIRGDMRPVRSDPINRYLYGRGADAVVCTNSKMAKSMEERLGKIESLRVIFGGVDENVFTPVGQHAGIREEFGISPSSLMMGLLGRTCEVKGHADLLAATRMALEGGADVDLVLLIKHSEDLPRYITDALDGMGQYRKRVHILGHRKDLPQVLRDFDLGLITSTGSEANCRVGLEWMGCGVPLLSTTIGVLPDIVEEGETGLLVSPGFPSELAAKIVYLSDNRELVKSMGQKSREAVLKRFTLGGQCDAYEELLTAITGGGRNVENH